MMRLGIAFPPYDDPEGGEQDEKQQAERGAEEDHPDEVGIFGAGDGEEGEVDAGGDVVEKMGGGSFDRSGKGQVDEKGDRKEDGVGEDRREIPGHAVVGEDAADAEKGEDGAVFHRLVVRQERDWRRDLERMGRNPGGADWKGA